MTPERMKAILAEAEKQHDLYWASYRRTMGTDTEADRQLLLQNLTGTGALHVTHTTPVSIGIDELRELIELASRTLEAQALAEKLRWSHMDDTSDLGAVDCKRCERGWMVGDEENHAPLCIAAPWNCWEKSK